MSYDLMDERYHVVSDMLLSLACDKEEQARLDENDPDGLYVFFMTQFDLVVETAILRTNLSNGEPFDERLDEMFLDMIRYGDIIEQYGPASSWEDFASKPDMLQRIDDLLEENGVFGSLRVIVAHSGLKDRGNPETIKNVLLDIVENSIEDDASEEIRAQKLKAGRDYVLNVAWPQMNFNLD